MEKYTLFHEEIKKDMSAIDKCINEFYTETANNTKTMETCNFDNVKKCLTSISDQFLAIITKSYIKFKVNREIAYLLIINFMTNYFTWMLLFSCVPYNTEDNQTRNKLAFQWKGLPDTKKIYRRKTYNDLVARYTEFIESLTYPTFDPLKTYYEYFKKEHKPEPTDEMMKEYIDAFNERGINSVISEDDTLDDKYEREFIIRGLYFILNEYGSYYASSFGFFDVVYQIDPLMSGKRTLNCITSTLFELFCLQNFFKFSNDELSITLETDSSEYTWSLLVGDYKDVTHWCTSISDLVVRSSVPSYKKKLCENHVRILGLYTKMLLAVVKIKVEPAFKALMDLRSKYDADIDLLVKRRELTADPVEKKAVSDEINKLLELKIVNNLKIGEFFKDLPIRDVMVNDMEFLKELIGVGDSGVFGNLETMFTEKSKYLGVLENETDLNKINENIINESMKIYNENVLRGNFDMFRTLLKIRGKYRDDKLKVCPRVGTVSIKDPQVPMLLLYPTINFLKRILKTSSELSHKIRIFYINLLNNFLRDYRMIIEEGNPRIIADYNKQIEADKEIYGELPVPVTVGGSHYYRKYIKYKNKYIQLKKRSI